MTTAVTTPYPGQQMKPTPVHFLSIVIPVYNEADNLPVLFERLGKVVSTLPMRTEVLLVDDGSRDASCTMITAKAAEPGSPFVAVILNRNYGQHAAIMAGFSKVRGDLIITLDADLQNPPEEIPNLIAQAEQGFDVVGTIRMNRQDTWFRKTASKIVNTIMRKATGIQMSDYGCMLRAYRRPIVDIMVQCNERSTFIPLLATTFARNTTEIHVKHEERAAGDSKYSLMKLINLQFDLLTSMTTAPLRLLTFVGIAIAIFGFVFGVVLLVLRLMYGSQWGVDGVFPLFALLFIFVGAQFMGFGLLGEYIGRIYSDVRARPRFIIEEVIGQD
jgi:undecaprenyl-phosphate 4-deoxy-4-formamido-L-arabinose transferase